MAKETGIEQDYEEEVIVTDEDLRETLLTATSRCDTICVGATRSIPVAQALFGSIPEEIGEKSNDTVAIARGSVYKPRSVTRGLIDWLSG